MRDETSVMSSSMVLSGSFTKGCARSALSLKNFFSLPSTIFSAMWSGLPSSFTCSRYTERSRSITSCAISSWDTANGAVDAMCIARSLASAWKSSVFATKSVSQLTSTITAVLPSKWM